VRRGTGVGRWEKSVGGWGFAPHLHLFCSSFFLCSRLLQFCHQPLCLCQTSSRRLVVSTSTPLSASRRGRRCCWRCSPGRDPTRCNHGLQMALAAKQWCVSVCARPRADIDVIGCAQQLQHQPAVSSGKNNRQQRDLQSSTAVIRADESGCSGRGHHRNQRPTVGLREGLAVGLAVGLTVLCGSGHQQ
jgi:hypothetical protein